MLGNIHCRFVNMAYIFLDASQSESGDSLPPIFFLSTVNHRTEWHIEIVMSVGFSWGSSLRVLLFLASEVLESSLNWEVLAGCNINISAQKNSRH